MRGEVVGDRYRLIESIGKGSFGEVWRAEQIGVGREVALKLMHSQELDPSALGRFRREADLARRLEHPNTVRLLDYGSHTPDRPFIVYELLRGQSVGSLLRREGRFSEARAVRITSQVLKSLMEAHQLGVVHRDIKPENIFVGEYAGEPDFVKVLDFGIAKSLHSSTKFMTQTGEVVGTPAYMPPEQVAGGDVAPRWDLWAVAVVLAEMLSGERVFRGSPMDVLVSLVSNEPVPLPAALGSSRFVPFIRRALDKDPRRRPETARQMLGELEKASQSAPQAKRTSAPPVASTIEAATVVRHLTPIPQPISYPPPSPPAPSRAPIIAAAVVGLGLLLLGVVTLALFAWVGRSEPEATAPSALAPPAVSVKSLADPPQPPAATPPPSAPQPKPAAAPRRPAPAPGNVPDDFTHR